jgi:hypothetical protein
LDCDRLSQPLFLGRLVRHFSAAEAETAITVEEAYIYAAGVVLCSALNVIVIHPYMMAIFHMGMKIRVACCSLIYRKVTLGNYCGECEGSLKKMILSVFLFHEFSGFVFDIFILIC